MRKVLSLVLCLVMLVAVFAACAKEEPKEPAASEAPKSEAPKSEAPKSEEPSQEPSGEAIPVGNGTLSLSGNPTEITFWITVNDVDDAGEMEDSAWDEIVADFQAKYPMVTVKLEGVGKDASENTAVWNTAAAANNLPELVYTVDGYIVKWEGKDIITDVSGYLSDDFKAAFSGPALSNANAFATEDGAVYVIPCCQEVEGWLFNTTILSANNCEVPKTFDEFVTVVQTLKANGVLPISHGGSDTWAIWGYHEFTNQYGWTNEACQKFEAGEIGVKDTAFYKAFGKIYELAQAGAFAADVATTTNDTAGAMFVEGQAAIWQIYDGYRHGQMQTYDTDPEAYASYYDVLMNSVFRLGLEIDDDIFADGEVHGIKMNNWGVYTGSCAAKDPDKLAACVAFLEFFVSEEEYERFVAVSSNIPLVWTSENSYDYSMWGLEQSYYESYALDGTFFHEPTDWFTLNICDDYRNAVTGLICGSLDVEGACEIFDTWQASNVG